MSNESLGLPTDEVMRQIAKFVVEATTTSLADYAEEFAATDLVKDTTGEEALKAFASAIRATNTAMYPPAESEAS